MNNKIRKLAKQAGLNFGTNISGVELVYGTFEGSTISHIDSDELAKFAELIVRECIDILPEEVNVNDTYAATILVKCGTAIKEHFGVKE